MSKSEKADWAEFASDHEEEDDGDEKKKEGQKTHNNKNSFKTCPVTRAKNDFSDKDESSNADGSFASQRQCNNNNNNIYDDYDDDDDVMEEEKAAIKKEEDDDDILVTLAENGEKNEDDLRPSSPFVVLNYDEGPINQKAVDVTLLALKMELRKVVKQLKQLRKKERERRYLLFSGLLKNSNCKNGLTNLFFSYETRKEEDEEEEEEEGEIGENGINTNSSDVSSEIVENSFMTKYLKDDAGIYIDIVSDTVKSNKKREGGGYFNEQKKNEEWVMSEEGGSKKKNLLNGDYTTDTSDEDCDKKSGEMVFGFKSKLKSTESLCDNNTHTLLPLTEVECEGEVVTDKKGKGKVFCLSSSSSSSSSGHDGKKLSRCYLLQLGKVLLNGDSDVSQTGCCNGETVKNDGNFLTTAQDRDSDNENETTVERLKTACCYLGTLSTDETGLLEFVFNKDDAVKRLAFRKKESELMLAEKRISFEIEALYRCVANDKNNWQSDESAQSCPRCTKDFSFTVRKHHCRRCGALLCNDCCSHVGRDMYAQAPERFDSGEMSKVCVYNTDGNGAPVVSVSTASPVFDNAWMFDTHNLSQGDYWRQTAASSGASEQQQQLKCLTSLSSSFSPTVKEPNNNNNDINIKNITYSDDNYNKNNGGGGRGGGGGGGLQVRFAPWCRICNCCYLICLRARVEKNYSDILSDGRRRFHVLRGDEQSLKNINTTWETRIAQMDVLKHVIFEKSTNILQRQVRNIAETLRGWLRSTMRREKKKTRSYSKGNSGD